MFTGSPDGMFTAGMPGFTSLVRLLVSYVAKARSPNQTFVSSKTVLRGNQSLTSYRSSVNWEALICGPKETPFVSHE
jgi:hypothetical protein